MSEAATMHISGPGLDAPSDDASTKAPSLALSAPALALWVSD